LHSVSLFRAIWRCCLLFSVVCVSTRKKETLSFRNSSSHFLSVENTGVMAFLVDKNPDIWPAGERYDGQIINIVGGVSLMIAQFIVSFWYGTSIMN
jgi:hypothetical protein